MGIGLRALGFTCWCFREIVEVDPYDSSERSNCLLSTSKSRMLDRVENLPPPRTQREVILSLPVRVQQCGPCPGWAQQP